MLTYWNYKQGLRTQDEWSPNCWIQATCPTPEDEEYLTQTLKVPDYFLHDIRDKDERARYDYDEGWTKRKSKVAHHTPPSPWD